MFNISEPPKVGFCIDPLRGSLGGQLGNTLSTLFIEKKFKGQIDNHELEKKVPPGTPSKNIFLKSTDIHSTIIKRFFKGFIIGSLHPK